MMMDDPCFCRCRSQRCVPFFFLQYGTWFTKLTRCVIPRPHLSFIDKGGVSSEEKVHVRVQQRNGRKCITTVAGLADDLDVKRICKAFKKNFSCNGAVQKDLEVGEVIQLSGDQRTNVKEFLVDQEICHSENVVLHGF